MQKGHYIDSVMQMVEGGDINDESEVWRDDIEALLPAAVNFALVGGLFDQSNQEHDRDIPGSFIIPFLAVDLDLTGPTPKFDLPQTIVPLSSDRGVRMITSEQGDHVYEKMNDNLYAAWHYWKQIMRQRYFRLIQRTVFLYNKGPLESKVNIYLVVSAENYAETDDLPVPAGKEFVVITQLLNLFIKQRAEAQQNIQFKSDINK